MDDLSYITDIKLQISVMKMSNSTNSKVPTSEGQTVDYTLLFEVLNTNIGDTHWKLFYIVTEVTLYCLNV